MPALVVWEPLIAAGDDLRCLAVVALILRMIQISLVSYVVYSVKIFEHRPEVFVVTGCLSYEERYWMWHRAAIAGCSVILAYGIVGALIEALMFSFARRGTPTETYPRRHLVPLCKCRMVPMLILRAAGFVWSVIALLLTESFCNCAKNNLPEELLTLLAEEQGRTIFSACPIDSRDWYVAARVLIFTMACDAIFPTISLIVVLRQRIHKVYRRVRPKRERQLEDEQKYWQTTCRHCCRCCSLMTCYMCGGDKLTSGSYADVAFALTHFLDGHGKLDIVPSDIAAALICLVNVQKQRQIECKNELLREGGILAKDKVLLQRLWREFETKTNVGIPNLNRATERKREVSLSLRKSLSLSMDSLSKADDTEAGLQGSLSSTENMQEDGNIEVSLENGCQARNSSRKLSASMGPSDADLEQLRQSILTSKELRESVDFRLSHKDNTLLFEPTISRMLSPNESFDCLLLGELIICDLKEHRGHCPSTFANLPLESPSLWTISRQTTDYFYCRR
ncbi:hypothetical protein ACHAWF_007285 [Thalassiosira exigua]